MNNFEVISRALSQDNADISELKTETDKLKTKIKSKEDGFIILNTDAFSGLIFGSETTINLEQNIVLNLFNASSTEELYSQIRKYDNKTFVLKPNGNSFTVDGIQYIITACNPCIGKIYDYNGIPTLCLTFLIDTVNSQTALFKFFISANSNTEISGKLTVENIINGYREVFHGSNDTTFTLTPNTFHVWDKVSSLTLDFGNKIRGAANEYLFQFISGPIATSLTLPNSIKWANNSVPTIKPNMIYQVSILRGLASALEFTSDMYFDFHNYLTIEALEDNLTVTFTNNIEYKIDDNDWVSLNTGDETLPINLGQTLSFRGELVPEQSKGIGTFTISKKCTLKGNCMSMIFGDNASDNYSLSGKNWAFCKLFYNCENIVNVDSNFLPATTLAEYCYYNMFQGCTNLTTTPELPATTLAHGCYATMFQGCSNLTTAPELPATTLASSCYNSMFWACTNLVNAPQLPATTLASWCYNGMFEECYKLTTAPGLPATTLADNCYRYMFHSCINLTTAPELPATTLVDSCYFGMFYDCASLTTAPELPAESLASSCYADMFINCTSLTTAPELPATTLAERCYNGMFNNCNKLNYIKMLATDISASNCLNNWVGNVSPTGTFIKNAAMESLPTGSSGIPDGWAVQNA